MKSKYLIFFLLCTSSITASAQDTTYQNTATSMIHANNRLSIRGYAEVNYNQGFANGIKENSKLEVRRMVLFTGYKFNRSTSFISEIEVEHGNEIYLEQAFINHRINPYINFRAGLLLIPMGIVNEYHEPTTYNGVERPSIDRVIVPTTWREIGVGFQGLLPQANLSYQLYVVNGLKSHDGENGLISSSNGFRKGRQKGIRSTMSSPNLSAKLDYFGVRNLKIGLATYIGTTQSPLYQGIATEDDAALRIADSSVLQLAIFGIDARYAFRQWRMRGQVIIGNIGNTEAYNAFVGGNLSSSVYGYYAELAYNVLPLKHRFQLYPFLRYEQYDTQAATREWMNNDQTKRQEITAGLSFFLHPGVVLKADYNRLIMESGDYNRLDLGVGVWF